MSDPFPHAASKRNPAAQPSSATLHEEAELVEIMKRSRHLVPNSMYPLLPNDVSSEEGTDADASIGSLMEKYSHNPVHGGKKEKKNEASADKENHNTANKPSLAAEDDAGAGDVSDTPTEIALTQEYTRIRAQLKAEKLAKRGTGNSSSSSSSSSRQRRTKSSHPPAHVAISIQSDQDAQDQGQTLDGSSGSSVDSGDRSDDSAGQARQRAQFNGGKSGKPNTAKKALFEELTQEEEGSGTREERKRRKKKKKKKSQKKKSQKQKKSRNKHVELSSEDDGGEWEEGRGANTERPIFISQPFVEDGLRKIEAAIHESNEKSRQAHTTLHLGLVLALVVVGMLYFSANLLLHLPIYQYKDTVHYTYIVSSLVLMILASLCYLQSLLSMWLGLHAFSRTVVISQVVSCVLFVSAGAFDVPGHHYYGDDRVEAGLGLLALAVFFHIIVVVCLLAAAIKSDSNVTPKVHSVKQLELATHLIRTVEQQRGVQYDTMVQELESSDKKIEVLRDSLVAKEKEADRLRKENNFTNDELGGLKRKVKEWEVKSASLQVSQAKEMLEDSQQRHEAAMLSAKRQLQSLETQLANTKSLRDQWETRCLEKTDKLDRTLKLLEESRLENSRLVQQNKSVLEAANLDAQHYSKEINRLQGEYKEAEQHHYQIMANVTSRVCPDCQILKTKLANLKTDLKSTRALQDANQKLNSQLHAMRKHVVSLRKERNLDSQVADKELKKISAEVEGFSHYINVMKK